MSAAKKAYVVFALAAVFAIPVLCIAFGAVGLVHARQIDHHGVAARAYVESNTRSLRGDFCESANGLPVAFDFIAPALILLLVSLNVGVAMLGRDGQSGDGRHEASPTAMTTA